MAKNKRYKLVLLSLTIGLLIGLTVLGSKIYLKNQIKLLLSQLVESATGCDFKVDRINLSYFTLKARAFNPRIVCESIKTLGFQEIELDISLDKIRDKEIIFSELILYNGTTNSVAHDSPTFKFINYLITGDSDSPSNPEGMKVELLKLKVQNGNFHQDFEDINIDASGVNVELIKTPQGNYLLIPEIAQIKINIKDEEKFVIGKAGAKIALLKDKTLIERATIKSKKNLVDLSGSINYQDNNQIEGAADFSINPSIFGIEQLRSFVLQGQSKIKGDFDKLELTGDVKNKKGSTASFINQTIVLTDFVAAYTLNINDRKLSATVDINGDLNNGEVRTTKQLRLTDNYLSGTIAGKFGQLTYNGVSINDIAINAELSSTIDAPVFNVTGQAAQIGINERHIKDISFGLNGSSKELILNAQNSDRSLLINGQLINLHRDIPILKSLSIKADRVPLWNTTVAKPEFVSLLTSIDGELSGELSAKDLRGNFNVELIRSRDSVSPFLDGQAILTNGLLNLEIKNNSTTLNVKYTSDLRSKKGKLLIEAKKFSISEIEENNACSLIDGILEFNHGPQREDYEGSLMLRNLVFGCAPNELVLPEPYRIIIQNGSATIKNLILKSYESDLNIEGTISIFDDINISAQGTVDLNSILPLIPTIDDLRGKLEIQLNAKGSFALPLLSGRATLSDGEVFTQSIDIGAEKLNGSFTLKDGDIHINDLRGSINGGDLNISGHLAPVALAESDLKIVLSNVQYTPIDNSLINVSAELSLQPGLSAPFLLNGTIVINSGEIERNLTLRTLIQSLTSGRSKSDQLSGVQSDSLLKQIDLELTVQAPNNLFVMTNWAEAEMSGDFQISGTLIEPSVQGEFRALSGWFGLKDRRFNISNGILTISPLSIEPIINLTGETLVPSISGERVLVVIDAEGPISSPRITFSSDLGLSENELISLVTSSGFELSQSLLDDLSTPLGLSRLKRDRSFLGQVYYLFKSITDIDSLSIEPAYNDRTGSLEPKLIAEKNITPRLQLVGKNSLGTDREAGIFGYYKLLPDLTFITGLETSLLDDKTTYSADLAYTVLSSKIPFVIISIEGNKIMSRYVLLEALRIDEDSRILWNSLDALTKRLGDLYKDRGYFSSAIDFSCSDDGEYCRELSIVIDEGEPTQIQGITFKKDDISKYEDIIKFPSSGEIATNEALESLHYRILKALRDDGYIKARVSLNYESLEQDNLVELIVSVELGSPVVFNFRGNSKFTSDDFLDTIDIYERRQPFGPNTIFILEENIESLYRRAGFLNVEASHQEIRDPQNGTITYSIDIQENESVRVDEVIISGNVQTSRSELLDLLQERQPTYFNRFLKPKFAIAEEIEFFRDLIGATLKEKGFNSVVVDTQVVPVSSNRVNIEYIITEGDLVTTKQIIFEGLPDSATPKLVPGSYSITIANGIMAKMLNDLKGIGFPNAIITSGPFEPELFTIFVEAGDRTKIEHIYIIGTSQVSESRVRDFLKVYTGDFWDESKIAESRRMLIQSGLFSRVQIEPADGAYDSSTESIVVKVVERSLRSLDVGIGANSEFGLHLFGEYIDRKIFLDGRYLAFRLDTYYDRDVADVSKGVASLRYIDPFVLGYNLRLTEDLRFQRLKLGSLPFDLDRVSLSSFADRNITEKTKINFGHTILREDLSKVENDVILSDLDNGLLTLSILSASLNFDNRDSAIIPRKGYYFGFDARAASEVLASEANYGGGGVRFSFYKPLDFAPSFTIANNTRFAALVPYGDTKEIPISQRYFTGGHNTVRGFRENSLGPKGVDGNPIGGDYMFNNNFEFQYSIDNDFQFVTFLDLGSVFLQSQSSSISDLRKSAGIAFRYLSPIGAIGLDLGFPLDEKPGEPSTRLHFNLSTHF